MARPKEEKQRGEAQRGETQWRGIKRGNRVARRKEGKHRGESEFLPPAAFRALKMNKENNPDAGTGHWFTRIRQPGTQLPVSFLSQRTNLI